MDENFIIFSGQLQNINQSKNSNLDYWITEVQLRELTRTVLSFLVICFACSGSGSSPNISKYCRTGSEIREDVKTGLR